MKIGLFGYGKMGKAIEKIASQQGHEIVWRINRDNIGAVDEAFLRQADIAIEFTRPESGFENVMRCLQAGVPVVSGTTGWSEQLPTIKNYCEINRRGCLWSSNFSLGVNIFFEINRQLARLMNNYSDYEVSITEIHHAQKLDAPSGTAISIAKDLIEILDRKDNWRLKNDSSEPSGIEITALRQPDVPGTHTVSWRCPIDEITIQHQAFSREGFAFGAVLAAKWLRGRHGLFTMRDVLNI